MEPMTLGSTPSSPSSPGTNPNYLPAFLMGDTQPSPPSSPLSPELRKNVSFNIIPSDKSTLRQKLFSPSVPESRTPQSTYEINDTPGPPKQSLFDTIDVKRGANSRFSANKTAITSPLQPDSFSRSFNESVIEHTHADVIRSGITQNTWVTVFGFPPTAASVVLVRFANCGTIVDKQFPTQGNWVHLKYSNALEASKALALNGKLVSNSIMVGVASYNANTDKENNSPMPKTPMRARSLRLSFVSPQHSNTVLTPENVPQKSTGIFTKAMDYVLGW